MKLEYVFYIDAEPRRVWEVLFDPELSLHAFMGGVIESSLQVGDSIQFVGPGQDGQRTVHIYGTVLAYEPYKRLSYTDHPGPVYYENHEKLESRVTLTLDKVGGCTKLQVVNDQWTDNNPVYKSAKHLWWMILSNIKTIAETGKSLEFG